MPPFKPTVVLLSVFTIGVIVGFYISEHFPRESYEDCISREMQQIAKLDLSMANHFYASTQATKACDKAHEQQLEPDKDLEQIMSISASMRFGEDGKHTFFISNSSPDFIITKIKLKMSFGSGQSNGPYSTTISTGYIHVGPGASDYEITRQTRLYDVDGIDKEKFKLSIAEVWGVRKPGQIYFLAPRSKIPR
ncbi:hypothetical protein QQM79_19625 [Marinobacteraceae bacterium S3BR75-40.1]